MSLSDPQGLFFINHLMQIVHHNYHNNHLPLIIHIYGTNLVSVELYMTVYIFYCRALFYHFHRSIHIQVSGINNKPKDTIHQDISVSITGIKYPSSLVL